MRVAMVHHQALLELIHQAEEQQEATFLLHLVEDLADLEEVQELKAEEVQDLAEVEIQVVILL
jgi:hypothetical protein